MTSDLSARACAWRHRLHQHPETGDQEHEASQFVVDALEGLGLDVLLGIGGTDVVASMTRDAGTTAIGLRAAMDGLPLPEHGGKAQPSRNDGVTHDGHLATVLGAPDGLLERFGTDAVYGVPNQHSRDDDVNDDVLGVGVRSYPAPADDVLGSGGGG